MKQFEEEKVKWEQQREAAAKAGKTFDDAEPTMDEERERAWQVGKQHQGSIVRDCHFSLVVGFWTRTDPVPRVCRGGERGRAGSTRYEGTLCFMSG